MKVIQEVYSTSLYLYDGHKNGTIHEKGGLRSENRFFIPPEEPDT